MFSLSARVWIFILNVPKFLPRVQTLGTKSAKKYCHVSTLEAFHLWILGTSMKAKRPNSCSLPIKLLDFFHLSTKRHSVKPSLVVNIRILISNVMHMIRIFFHMDLIHLESLVLSVV